MSQPYDNFLCFQCRPAMSWSWSTISPSGIILSRLSLALPFAGLPRLLWRASSLTCLSFAADLPWSADLHFLVCSSLCPSLPCLVPCPVRVHAFLCSVCLYVPSVSLAPDTGSDNASAKILRSFFRYLFMLLMSFLLCLCHFNHGLAVPYTQNFRFNGESGISLL